MTELKPCDNFEPTGAWLDPTPEMLDTVLFDVIWRTIKMWDVNVPHAYSGYMGATGNHARAIYDAVVPLFHRPGDEAKLAWEPDSLAWLDQFDAETKAMIVKRDEALARKVLEAAVLAVAGEWLDDPQPETSDIAYQQAISDAQGAIFALNPAEILETK